MLPLHSQVRNKYVSFMNGMRQLKQFRYLFGIMLATGVALSAVSCTQDDVIQDSRSLVETDKVAFGILKNATWDDPDITDTQTKGESVTVSTLNKFNVLANITGSDNTTSLFFKQGYTKNGSDWTAQNIYYWPGSNWTMDFYATNAEINDDATITHTIKNSMKDQEDIVVAKQQNVKGDYNQVVGLSFDHILTAVSFKIGSIPYGNIKSIKFENVYTSGVYDMTKTKGQGWSYSTNKGNCEFTPPGTGISPSDLKTGGTPLGKGQYFFMIPQTLGDSALVVIEFADGDKEKDFTLTKNLSTQQWKEGESVVYTMNIYSFDYEDGLEIVDAHYVMPVLTLSTTGFSDDADWQIEVSSDVNTKADGETPSIQFEDDVNSLVSEGYWTDRYKNEDGSYGLSARGSSTIDMKGNADGKKIRVFIPENNSEKDRNIYLSYKKDGVLISQDTIIQKCPVWKGDYGWEVDDEGTKGTYGFSWDRKVSYVYVYSAGEYNTTKHNSYSSYVKSFQTLYDSTGVFTTLGSFVYERFLGYPSYRYYMTIDYSKASTVQSYDLSSGLNNTKILYSYNGGSKAAELETVLKTTKKTENGKTAEEAFANGKNSNYSGKGLGESGNSLENVSSSALSVILKKNKYNILKKEDTVADDESNNTFVSYLPVINEADIVWYLPAVNQNSLPDDASGNYWSSTAVSGGTQAYLIGGVAQSRTSEYEIRAVRNKN
jgi:hypothetical protein